MSAHDDMPTETIITFRTKVRVEMCRGNRIFLLCVKPTFSNSVKSIKTRVCCTPPALNKNVSVKMLFY